MASKQFNSVDGYAVGNATVVIYSNSSVAGNVITASANVTAPQFISNVSTGTAPFVVNSTTQVANLNVATAGSATTAGTVTTAAQPNITSVGTLTSLAVTGNVTAANFVGNLANGNSSISIPAANGNVNITAVGNTTLVVTGVSANLTGTLFATGRYETTFQVLGRSTSAAGNGYLDFNAGAASGNIYIRDGSSFTNRIFINTNGNVGIANSSPTHTLSVTGTMNVSGNANVGNIGATNGVFTNVSGNGAGLTAIAGANITGTVANATYATSAGTAGSATTAGTVTTNAQPNITSTGALTSPSFTANSATGRILLATDGGGSISMGRTDGAASTPYIDFNTSLTVVDYDARIQASGNTGTVGGGTLTFTAASANFSGTINGNGSGLSAIAGANVTGTVANATYATSAGSATTAGTVTTAAQPNITSVGTLTSVAVSGNANASTFRVTNGTANAVTSVLTFGADNLFQFTTQNGTATNSSGQEVARVGINYSGTGWDSFTQYVRGGSSQNGWQILYAGNTAIANVSNTGVAVTGTISATGNISGANLISSAYSIVSVGTGISAAGTTQGTGTVLTKQFNVVSTVASGAGVVLPSAVAGMRITVLNTSANALLVYPASTGIINSQAANAAYSQPAGARLDYISTSTTQWYTLNATYG